MRTCDFFKNKNIHAKPTNEGSEESSEEKKKLLREIKDLQSIIEQCEWSLDTLRFKDVEKHVTELESSNVASSRDSHKRSTNVEVDLQNVLYKCGGLYCFETHKDEAVFKFPSAKENQKDYALQIFVKNGKANLGKWVMPPSIDMNQLLSETPIDELHNLNSFIRNCKHHIECYTIRQEQFLSLKEYLSNMKHYVLQSNSGYTHINLELYGTHDSQKDKYINLVIYFLYQSNRARPHKIQIDTTDHDKLSDELKQRLKTSLKEFKISDLQTAFEKVLMQDDSVFTWMRTDDSDSPMELSNTSSSEEEGFLMQRLIRKKLKKTKRTQELQKKWNERKKQKVPRKNIASHKKEDNKEANKDKEKEDRLNASCSESSEQQSSMSTKSDKTDKIKATSSKQQKNIDKNVSHEVTPLMPRPKLKQTKLNFHIDQPVNSDNTDKSHKFDLKSIDKINKFKSKLVTSTPISARYRRMSSYTEISNITEINPQMTDKLNDSGKRLKSFKNTTELNISKGNELSESKDNSRKKLRNKRSVTVRSSLHSQTPKIDKRFTRSMTKNKTINE